MAILGNNSMTNTGGGFSGAVGRKVASKFTLATAQTLQELHAFFYTGTGSHVIVLHIYADSSGSPGALVANSSQITVPDIGDFADVSQTGFSVPLAAGDYWLGMTFSSAKGNIAGDLGGTHRAILSGATVFPPSNPFGTPDNSGTNKFGCWAVVGAAVAGCTAQQITHCSASLPCSDGLANRSTASVSCGPSLTTSATIVKQAGKTTQATVATTATIRKQIGKQLGTVVASAATIVKQARKALAGTPVATGATLTPLYLHAGVTNPKALSVSVVTTASLSAVKVTPFVPGADQQDVAALVAAVGGGIGA
jgi:hypothetical protein